MPSYLILNSHNILIYDNSYLSNSRVLSFFIHFYLFDEHYLFRPLGVLVSNAMSMVSLSDTLALNNSLHTFVQMHNSVSVRGKITGAQHYS